MPRVENTNLTPAGDARDAIPPDARFYRYDPNLGSPRDVYTRADVVHPEARQPELPGRFVAYVEGETMLSTMHGARKVVWRAEPGTECIILGYWSDGTVHLKWPAIGGVYRVDGRFPAWVAAEDTSATLAGGGRILSANDPPPRGRTLPFEIVAAAALVVVALLILAIPPARDALGALVDLLRPPH
jgi:hypothetical protein